MIIEEKRQRKHSGTPGDTLLSSNEINMLFNGTKLHCVTM
jgi:hypothetical protein